MDVAACFEALLDDAIIRERLAAAAGMAGLDAVTRARLCAIAFLHDFGKLNPGFQWKVAAAGARPKDVPRQGGHIAEAVTAFDSAAMCDALDFWTLQGWGPGAGPLLLAALAHHGGAVTPAHPGPSIWRACGGYDPVAAAGDLAAALRRWLPEAFLPGPELPDSPALQHLFAGLLAIADQIGSEARIFPFVDAEMPDYAADARARARKAMAEAGFARDAARKAAPALQPEALLGVAQLRPLQQAVAGAPSDAPLLILESETGSGKRGRVWRPKACGRAKASRARRRRRRPILR